MLCLVPAVTTRQPRCHPCTTQALIVVRAPTSVKSTYVHSSKKSHCMPKVQPPDQHVHFRDPGCAQACARSPCKGLCSDLLVCKNKNRSNSQRAKSAHPPDALPLPPGLCDAAQGGCCTPTRRQGPSCVACHGPSKMAAEKSTASRLAAPSRRQEKRHAYEQSQEGE